jgi:hypothetical protein
MKTPRQYTQQPGHPRKKVLFQRVHNSADGVGGVRTCLYTLYPAHMPLVPGSSRWPSAPSDRPHAPPRAISPLEYVIDRYWENTQLQVEILTNDGHRVSWVTLITCQGWRASAILGWRLTLGRAAGKPGSAAVGITWRSVSKLNTLLNHLSTGCWIRRYEMRGSAGSASRFRGRDGRLITRSAGRSECQLHH